MNLDRSLDRLLDSFRSERETYFQIERNDREGPRCSELSVALPHVLAMAVSVVLTALLS